MPLSPRLEYSLADSHSLVTLRPLHLRLDLHHLHRGPILLSTELVDFVVQALRGGTVEEYIELLYCGALRRAPREQSDTTDPFAGQLQAAIYDSSNLVNHNPTQPTSVNAVHNSTSYFTTVQVGSVTHPSAGTGFVAPAQRLTTGSTPHHQPQPLPTPPYTAADAAAAKSNMPTDQSRRSTPNTIKNSPESNHVKETRPTAAESNNAAAAAKPKRVRTGCLTCRERHLKCDEGMPICQNCKKSSRKCKRGVRLNFIDIQCERPPHLLPRTHDWKVTFEDNSREIASEYKGGIEKYAALEPPPKRRRLTPPNDSSSFDYSQVSAPVLQHQQLPQQNYQAYGETSTAMYANAANQAYEDPSHVLHQQYADQSRQSYDQSMMMTTHHEPEPPALPLTNREEVFYMQVFVEEIGVWMDSMDKDKHFSRILPLQALREPMLKYALLACGVRHLTLVNSVYPEEHAVNYYNQANILLLKSLQNPNRDTVLCATTATVLNVYEVMSEKALQRMNHIAGARALIKECRWDGTATGIGAACFWLNVGLELFSCLHFNWGVAWDPDTWGIDMNMSPAHTGGNEEDWTHKVLWILAKITNFRSSIPRFQEQTVHAEQMRLQSRMQQWLGLKQFCDRWDKCVPATMHAMANVPVYMTSSKSAFPEVWYIKRATVVARLFYHTAMTLLGAVHPMADSTPQLSNEMAEMRLHHSRQICGIVAHVKDRGVATASIRCLAVAAEHLNVRREQEEVLEIFERIKKETGWRVAFINDELKEKWGWNATDFSNMNNSAFFQQGAPTMPTPNPRPRPPSGIINPLYKNADFAASNPPYQGNYVPPAPGYLTHNNHLYGFGGITAL